MRSGMMPTDPPHRQRERPPSPARKGPPIVAANAVWQAVLRKRACESSLRLLPVAEQPVAAEHESTEAIAHRQRIAIHAIAGTKFPFEIGRPHLVGAVPASARPARAPRRGAVDVASPSRAVLSQVQTVDRLGQRVHGSRRPPRPAASWRPSGAAGARRSAARPDQDRCVRL